MSLEKLLFGGRGGQPQTTDLDGVVTSASPYLVQCTGEDVPAEVIPLVAQADVGDRVSVITVGRRRYALPSELGTGSVPLSGLTAGTLPTTVRDSLVSQLAVPPSTAWTVVALASGFTGTTYWRIVAGQVCLAGTVARTAGNFPTGSYETILTLPAAARPSLPAGSSGLTLTAADNRGFRLAAYVSSAGELQIRGADATAGVHLSTITPWAVA